MHALGFAIVPERTEQALDAVMLPHKETYDEATETLSGHWDWWRPGGRWDGYLVSDEEMKARETDSGFNFAKENQDIGRNSCLASEVPADRRSPYFFVTPDGWTQRESYNHTEERFERLADYDARLAQALTAYPNHWVVVIDIHN